MAYTTIDNPELYFQTKTFSGNAGTNAITLDGSENMQPDWVWLKKRNGTANHHLVDSVRGAGRYLFGNLSNAEGGDGVDGGGSDLLVSFDSDGFTLDGGADSNASGATGVGWCWKAGTSFTNDASSTGIGSIDSAGSVSDTAGFSICTHTGTGSNATIKHGLSTAPKMIITKKRSASGGWQVGHESIGWQNGMYLYNTDASTGDAGAWNSTAPTSSIFYVGNSSFTNQSSATYVSYIFAEKKGYSKFGSYTGNGNADGTFVYTGFKPAWLLIKQSSGAGNDWLMYDNKRDTFNVANKLLISNGYATEATGQSFNFIDLLSNGFKLRGSDARNNGSGGTMIYMAFGESPFVNSNGVPNNAR